MFISPAYAQASGGSSDMLIQFLPIVLIIVVFYFLLIRPQQQKTKEHKAQLSGLRRGDRIVTGGGIIGTIAKVVSDEELLVDIADNVRVRVLRSTVTGVMAKTEPVAAKSDKDKDKDDEKDQDDDKKAKGRRAAGGG
jgi:preprotein translocase subunit YajC